MYFRVLLFALQSAKAFSLFAMMHGLERAWLALEIALRRLGLRLMPPKSVISLRRACHSTCLWRRPTTRRPYNMRRLLLLAMDASERAHSRGRSRRSRRQLPPATNGLIPPRTGLYIYPAIVPFQVRNALWHPYLRRFLRAHSDHIRLLCAIMYVVQLSRSERLWE